MLWWKAKNKIYPKHINPKNLTHISKSMKAKTSKGIEAHAKKKKKKTG